MKNTYFVVTKCSQQSHITNQERKYSANKEQTYCLKNCRLVCY